MERSWESYCGQFEVLLEERGLLSEEPAPGPESEYFDANDQEELARRAPDEQLAEAHRTIAEVRPFIDDVVSGEQVPDPDTADVGAVSDEFDRYLAATDIVTDALVECDVLPTS